MAVPEEGEPLDQRVARAEHLVAPGEHQVGVGLVGLSGVPSARVAAGPAGVCGAVDEPVDRDVQRDALQRRRSGLVGTEAGAPQQAVDHRLGQRWPGRRRPARRASSAAARRGGRLQRVGSWRPSGRRTFEKATRVVFFAPMRKSPLRSVTSNQTRPARFGIAVCSAPSRPIHCALLPPERGRAGLRDPERCRAQRRDLAVGVLEEGGGSVQARPPFAPKLYPLVPTRSTWAAPGK